MTASTILGYMSKSSQPNEYQAVRRTFHNLSEKARRIAIELMIDGKPPKTAVRKAKQEVAQCN